ncbi:MAG TPA: hypothetical protein VNG73_04175 [Gemmatimonadaceae bacterium]|jgi:hypothetical protein|nr:hypothetical protein [Gemmatimonadaceae bacterium]
MARAYTIAAAALTVQMPVKWLDNTLSHIKISGVVQEKQGVARRITIDGLLILSIAALLIDQLGVSLSRAIRMAETLANNNGLYTSPGGVDIRLDLEVLRFELLERLEHAVEVAPIPKRGRPSKSKTGRLD